MTKKPFRPTDIPTDDWGSSADAAAFANKLAAFIDRGFKRTMFTKDMYCKLSNLFGHIAHYNIHGFYQSWFETSERRVVFLRNIVAGGCFGPTYAVERALRQWVHSSGVLTTWEQIVADEREQIERTTLAILQAKYPISTPITPSEPAAVITNASPRPTQVGKQPKAKPQIPFAQQNMWES